MSDKLTGSCLCGAVTFEVARAGGGIVTCHCKDCQKASGAGASHNFVVKTEEVKVTKGKPKTFSKVVDSGRTLIRSFCGECGSPVFSQRKEMPEMIVVKAGTLDDKSGLKHIMDIWTVSASGWIPDDPKVEHHERGRPAISTT
jgi:hypothetical protein